MVVEQQQYQYGEVAGGEGQQVVAGFAETCLQVGFEGNDAGHGGDDGAQPADVYAQQQGRISRGVIGQQNRGGDIA